MYVTWPVKKNIKMTVSVFVSFCFKQGYKYSGLISSIISSTRLQTWWLVHHISIEHFWWLKPMIRFA